MRPRISEFSYGFALTRELIDRKWNGLELTAAPFLPSLIAEGRTGGGFDVALQTVNLLVFLQFKVSHLLTRRTAKGVKTGHMTVPYYRFDVHAPRLSDQHRLLLDLEASAGSVPRMVRYVAPAFYTEGEFDAAFFSGTVSDRSIFVAPSQIVLPDEEEHGVGFVQPAGTPVVLSDPIKIKGQVSYEAFDQALRDLATSSRSLASNGSEMEALREFLWGMTSAMEPDARPLTALRRGRGTPNDRIPLAEYLPRVGRDLKEMQPLDAIGRMAWTHFGCETIALGVRQ
jgi:hypothetical protein